jgi:hypothetical protein
VSNDLEKILLPEESKKDSQIAKIEDDLQAIKDSRNNERFAYAIVVTILADMVAFPHIAWGPALFIGFFEIILIIVLAEMCGFDRIYTVLTNAADIISKLRKGESASPS